MPCYSAEFRQEVLAACDAGGGTREVATKFDVSESWVRRIKQERREQGKIAPSKKRRRTPKWAAEADRIQAAIAKQPDLTLGELKAQLGTSLSVQTLCRALQKLRMTLKKKYFMPASSSAKMSPSDAQVGKFSKRVSIRKSSFFSTKRG